MATRRRGWVWIVAAVCAAIGLAGVASMRRSNPPAGANAAVISFMGYTNAPAPARGRFALLCVSNKAGYTIRWRGDCVLIRSGQRAMLRGDVGRARITNPSLPGAQYPATLAPGASMLIAVGEPIDPLSTDYWQFWMSFSRYTLAQRYLDLSFKYDLPGRVGPFVLLDSQRILDPTNNMSICSEWLGK